MTETDPRAATLLRQPRASAGPMLRTAAIVALALLAGVATAASPNLPREPRDPATDRFIVKWRDAAALPAASELDTNVRELATSSGLRLTRMRSIGGGLHVVRVPAELEGGDLDAALERLRADPRIESVEPDRRVHAHAVTPSDPLFGFQWFLMSGSSAQPAAIRATEAWELTRGGASAGSGSTIVAVIDTGVRFDHPDLLRLASGGKLLAGYDFVSADSANSFITANDGDGWDADPSDPGDWVTQADTTRSLCRGDSVSPSSWHGTRVAGLIGANTDNAVGVASAGFNVAILPVRALGKCGGFESDVLAALYWAAGIPIPLAIASTVPTTNPNPANVINLSLGATGSCSTQYRQVIEQITARGILVVASAGNEGAPVDSPANCSGVLAVGGLRHVGSKVGYSNLGPEVGISAPAGNCVNVAAGSPCLFSLDTTTDSGVNGPTGPAYTDQLNANVGTSFSGPLAAAVAGLMHTVNTRLTPAQLIARIKSSATPFPGTSDTVPAPPVCHTPTGQSDVQGSECFCTSSVCGAGMLNAAGAVAAALRPSATVAQGGTNSPGQTLTLDASGSGVADGRTVASYAWTVAATTGGASTPTLSAPNQAVTTVAAPQGGSYTIRLTITDSAGASESTDVTVTAASTVTGTVNPPGTGGGGGGAFDAVLLWVLAGLSAVTLAVRRRAPGSLRAS